MTAERVRRIGRGVLAIALLATGALLFINQSFDADGTNTLTPRAAGDFVRSIGVTTHLTYADYKSNAHFADVFSSIVRPKMRELGLHHVRQYPGEVDSSFPTYVAKYNELANPPAGYPSIKFNFETYVDAGVSSNPQNNCYMPKMKYIWFGIVGNCSGLQNYTTPSSVGTISVENPNEPDHCASFICNYSPNSSNWYGYSIQQNPDWPDDVLQTAEAAHGKLTGDAQAAGLERLAPAFVWLPYHQNETYKGVNLKTYLAPLKNFITHGNAHPYCNLQTVAACFNQQVKPVIDYYSPKPVIVTETGHSTAQFTEVQQAKYLLRILFDFFERGIPRTYVYEFLDEPSIPTATQQNFGLVNEDGREKPAFIWLKNAITLLKDDGSPTLEALPITVAGPAALRTTLLRKSNGSYWLALQHDKAGTVDADSSVAVTLTFASPKDLAYFNLESTNPYGTATNTLSTNLSIPDRVTLVKISEPPTATASPSGSGSTTNQSTQSQTKKKQLQDNVDGGTSSQSGAVQSTETESGLSLKEVAQSATDNPKIAWAAGLGIIVLLAFSLIIVRTRNRLLKR